MATAQKRKTTPRSGGIVPPPPPYTPSFLPSQGGYQNFGNMAQQAVPQGIPLNQQAQQVMQQPQMQVPMMNIDGGMVAQPQGAPQQSPIPYINMADPRALQLLTQDQAPSALPDDPQHIIDVARAKQMWSDAANQYQYGQAQVAKSHINPIKTMALNAFGSLLGGAVGVNASGLGDTIANIYANRQLNGSMLAKQAAEMMKMLDTVDDRQVTQWKEKATAQAERERIALDKRKTDIQTYKTLLEQNQMPGKMLGQDALNQMRAASTNYINTRAGNMQALQPGQLQAQVANIAKTQAGTAYTNTKNELAPKQLAQKTAYEQGRLANSSAAIQGRKEHWKLEESLAKQRLDFLEKHGGSLDTTTMQNAFTAQQNALTRLQAARDKEAQNGLDTKDTDARIAGMQNRMNTFSKKYLEQQAPQAAQQPPAPGAYLQQTQQQQPYQTPSDEDMVSLVKQAKSGDRNALQQIRYHLEMRNQQQMQQQPQQMQQQPQQMQQQPQQMQQQPQRQIQPIDNSQLPQEVMDAMQPRSEDLPAPIKQEQ